MRVYRLTSRLFANDPLSGAGAAAHGARWNGKGTRMGYTASSRSLAMMELLVHLASPRRPPRDRVMIAIDLPDDAVATPAALPPGWNELPYRAEVQDAGDAWIRAGTSLALRVPSAIVRAESTILVNPAHPRFREIVVAAPEPIAWDGRLFG